MCVRSKGQGARSRRIAFYCYRGKGQGARSKRIAFYRQFVVERHRIEDGLKIVVAVGAALRNVQAEVYLAAGLYAIGRVHLLNLLLHKDFLAAYDVDASGQLSVDP